MCSVGLLPKKSRHLTEEAATHFLGRLLLLRRKQKLSWFRFSRAIGISPETLYRWRRERRIPAEKAAAVCRELKIQEPEGLFVLPLSGPADFHRAIRRSVPWAPAASLRSERQAVGYAAVWLASQLEDPQLLLEPQLMLGDGELPASLLFVREPRSGQAVAHVQFSVKRGMMIYQAFSHRLGAESCLEFEGSADPEGFAFCLEFLRRRPEDQRVKAERLKSKIDRTLQKYHDQPIHSYKHAP